MEKNNRPLKQRIFGLDNTLMRASTKIFDLMILNFLFVLSCLPIITIGPAIVVLYSMTSKLRKEPLTNIGREYFQKIRENWKQGLFLSILASFLFLVLFLYLNIFNTMPYPVAFFAKLLCYGIGFVSLIIGVYAFQISAKFESSNQQLLKNAFYLGFLNFSKTLLLLGVWIPVIILLLYSPITMLLTLSVLLFIGFSVIAYLQMLILNPVFEKYSNEN